MKAIRMTSLTSALRRLAVLAAIALMVAPATSDVQAQGDSDNLVPNPSFEDSEVRRLKNYGELEEYTTDWFSATETTLDLYSEDMKSEKVNIPGNLYGSAAPSDGHCYAGLRTYSKDPRLYRTYYEVELLDKLEEDVMYCVSFDISLAELARYASNGVGAVLSDRKIDQSNTGTMVKDADVIHRSDKIMSLIDGWETVCGTVIGTGQEEYLLIGGFNSDSDIDLTKMKRPSGVSGAQKNHAYYYLDNVKVFSIDAKSQCVCSRADEVRTDVVYGASVVMNESMTDEECVSISAIYYAFLKRGATASGQATIQQLAEILKENPSWKLRLIGYTDDDEFLEGKVNPRYRDLGKKRADQVRRSFNAAGILDSRLVIESRENSDPANTRDTEISRAQNRRVTFEVIR
jgi:OmpA-OmpF porin, OOP family